jgi:hypothetical protein
MEVYQKFDGKTLVFPIKVSFEKYQLKKISKTVYFCNILKILKLYAFN